VIFQMSPKIPRQLLLLLGLVIGGRVIMIFALGWQVFPALLWPLLYAALSASALLGKQVAGKVLGYLLYAAGVLSIFALVAGRSQGLVGSIASLAWGILAIFTARYILKSTQVAAIYIQGKVLSEKVEG